MTTAIDAVDLTADPCLWSHDFEAFVGELKAERHPLAAYASAALETILRFGEIIDEANRRDRFDLHVWACMHFAELTSDLARACVAGHRGELPMTHAVALCESVAAGAVKCRASLVEAMKAVSS